MRSEVALSRSSAGMSSAARLMLRPMPSRTQSSLARVGHRLGDNAAGLAPAQPHVVGPFERDDSGRVALERLGGGDAGDQAQPRNFGERHRRAQDDRRVEIHAGRRMPRAAHPAAPGGLPLGDYDGALRGALAASSRAALWVESTSSK